MNDLKWSTPVHGMQYLRGALPDNVRQVSVATFGDVSTWTALGFAHEAIASGECRGASAGSDARKAAEEWVATFEGGGV